MKKLWIKKILLVGILSVSICSVAQAGKASAKQATAQGQPISLSIRTVQSTVHAGDPVLVNITITNNSKQPRLVETQIPTWLTDFDVRDNGGEGAVAAWAGAR